MAPNQVVLLHAHESGPNPIKVAIVLELLSVPYTLKMWQFGDGPNGVKGDAFLAINENGRVPALEDPNTGVVAWESGAVINYLLTEYDHDGKLGPKDASKQARVDFDKWIFFLVSGMAPMLGQVNWFRHYHAVDNKNALDRFIAQAYRTFDVLEAQLKKTSGGSVLGGEFSAVDAHFYPWVWEYEFGGLTLDGHPLIRKWFDNIAGMAEVKEAYAKIDKATKTQD
ncbi:hypothetical protein LTR56_026263 [Elasticomyces elasticus]|nr:hypothetical protein LTR56_026263 [Elasticomyces elasticus]KAK3618468.1 hypothetical protein LTR22_026364 [Elasticomyces elasticus]KAK4903738.1 hypothetical protein LTR49_026680 [Elasticomyces elasticus]